MVEALEKILSRIDLIIRYISPGFVSLGVLYILDPSFIKTILRCLSMEIWLFIIFVSLLGVLIYAIHQNLFVRILWGLVVFIQKTISKRFSCYKDRYDSLYEKFPYFFNKRYTIKIMECIEIERWKRRMTEDKCLKGIQNSIDSWATLMNLLYCSSYSFIIIPFLFGNYSPWNYRLKLVGLGLLFIALLSDWRITLRELYVIKKYPIERNTIENSSCLTRRK